MNNISHSCVCDTIHSSPIDRLYQETINSSALEVVEPPPVGNPSQGKTIRVQQKQHTWPVYLVAVPLDWKPSTATSLHPATKKFNNARVASEICALLNREYIVRSKDGYLNCWYIRIRKGKSHGILSINVPQKWKPESEFDMPPAFIRVDGPTEECKRVVTELNKRLMKDDSGKTVKRAYIGRSIDPRTFEAAERKAQ